MTCTRCECPRCQSEREGAARLGAVLEGLFNLAYREHRHNVGQANWWDRNLKAEYERLIEQVRVIRRVERDTSTDSYSLPVVREAEGGTQASRVDPQDEAVS